MNLSETSLQLAARAREKVFREAGEDVGVILSSNAANKGYLSGYFSVLHDLNPRYRCAVLAQRQRASLVVGAADAGPALETLGDEGLLFRYGVFFFESEPGIGPSGYDRPGASSFEEAFAAAAAAIVNGREVVGVDRSNDDLLWDLSRQRFGEARVKDVTDAIARARKIKFPGEIERLTVATRLVEAGLAAVASQARVGMTEWEIAAMMTAAMNKGGGVPRLVSVTSGPRSALADCYPSHRRVDAGDLLRIDAGCVVEGYTSDMARTFVFGEPDGRQAAAYRAIHVGLEEELNHVRAGLGVADLFEETVKVVRQNGIPTYQRQHVGHGLGLAGGYDFPVIAPATRGVFETGMCLCLETPYYVLGWGGMMIEDTIIVTDDGYEPITTTSRDLICMG